MRKTEPLRQVNVRLPVRAIMALRAEYEDVTGKPETLARVIRWIVDQYLAKKNK